MKHPISIALVTLVVCMADGLPAYSQTTAPDKPAIDRLLRPSTLCMIKLSADSINSPSGLFETKDFAPFIGAMQQYSDGGDVTITVDTPSSHKPPAVNVYVRQQGRSADQVTAVMKKHGYGPVRQSDEFLVMPLFGSEDRAETVADWKNDPARAAELDAALRTVADHPVQIAILPPRYLWRTYQEIQPTLPQRLGGGSIRVLTDGLVWAAVGISPQDLSAKIHVQSSRPDAATNLAAMLPKWMSTLSNGLPSAASTFLTKLLTDSRKQLKVDGSTIVAKIEAKGDGPNAAKEALLRVLAPANTHRKIGQLRRMMLAIHNHHSAYKYLPPGPKARDENGKPHLSWRVHLLPFLGPEERELWSQFHPDEPWDSDHNVTLVDQMPDVYAIPAGVLSHQPVRPGHTTFQAPSAENTVINPIEATRFRDVIDGLSNTVVIVEVKPENAVPWTAPQDYEFDPANPAADLFVAPDGKCNFALGDGATYRLPADTPPKTVHALFGMNDRTPTDVP